MFRTRSIDPQSRGTFDDAPELSQPALIAGVHPVSHSGGACIPERSMRVANV